MKKILLWACMILIVVLLVEFFYYLYLLKDTTPKYTSLSSVPLRADYDAWLKKNGTVTRSRLFSPDGKINLIVNQTEGQLKKLTVGKDVIEVTVETNKGPFHVKLPTKEFNTYVKPSNTKEELIPIAMNTLKVDDSVIIHESFIIEGEKIKNTNNGIVKLE